MIWLKKEEEVIKGDIIKSEKLVWKYHNLILLLLSIAFAVLILKSEFIRGFISRLGYYEYFGVFIVGLFYSYGFTTAPAISMLYLLSRDLTPFFVAIIGGFGAMISDYLIFRFIKYELFDEIKRLSNKIRFHPHLKKPYIKVLKKLAPFIAGIIFASPLPDELAASILGSIKFSDKKFLLLSFFSNSIGILIISLI